MNNNYTAELGRAIHADQTRLSAEMRKTAPDLNAVIGLAQSIQENAREILEMALWEQKRLEILSRNFTELLPELLGEKAGN